jgi:uncharacterized protein (TIGR04222 family)
VLVALWIAAPAAPAAAAGSAQGAGERIVAFAADLTINPDTTVDVTEKIRYDFGDDVRHGIFRIIPVRFDYEPDPKYERITTIDHVSVRGGVDTPAGVKVEGAGRSTTLRIGDPNRTISGVHDYTISYRVHGAMNGFADHDELFWNATGDQWAVPIAQVQVTVHAPGPITRVACYEGPPGSRLSCESATGGENGEATFSQNGLPSDEGVTVVVALPKGVVANPRPILDERWSAARAFSVTPVSAGLSGALTVLVVFGLVRVLGKGRDRRWAGSAVDAAFGNAAGTDERVPLLSRPHDPVEFEPPDKIRPGQVGTLIDEVANPLDVTATIVDLAVRGYLRIEEIPKQGWFGHTDWRLIKLKDGDGLLTYEETLLAGLFRDGDQVELSTLKRTFATRLHHVQDALYDDVVQAGWFPSRPDRVRVRWYAIGVVAVVVAAGITVALVAATHLGLLAVPFLVGGLGLLAGASKMPRRTPKGWATLRRVSGFRQFIEQSEKERARFAERANLFSEYLPYAVVFGCTEKWARAFAGLDDEVARSTTAWYISSQPFSVGLFTSSMDSFAVTTSGTIVATAASSGSSGFGGGSSGGGFGGGGGGSW